MRKSNSLKIAIDGPAGAGKSTVAKLLADELDLLYIDTGAMYRAATWLALKNKIDLENGEKIARCVKEAGVSLIPNEKNKGGRIKVFVGGDEEITEAIRTHQISDMVSTVAAHKEVREVLVEEQRKLSNTKNCVLDGRDIGTVVLPDAKPKIFLTASIEERARRRVLELESLGTPESYDSVLASMINRDQKDSSRKTAPLVKAPDAIEVSTDGLSIEEVVEKIANLIDLAETEKEVRK